MMHTTKTQATVFRAGLLLSVGLGLASLSVTRSAHASSNYPAALAAAIATQYPNAIKCVPLCTACHLTTAGGPGMMNKFGLSLEAAGLLSGNQDLVAGALRTLAMKTPAVDSDGDGTSDIDEIIAGSSPSLAAPNGEGQFCPDIKYGCGAHIAAAPPPPVDRVGLFSAGLVVLGFALIRRRRAASRAPSLRK